MMLDFAALKKNGAKLLAESDTHALFVQKQPPTDGWKRFTWGDSPHHKQRQRQELPHQTVETFAICGRDEAKGADG